MSVVTCESVLSVGAVDILVFVGGNDMARIVGIGYQNYQEVLKDHAFYIDKTLFIKEWWENLDRVTLITRPRRFGKTLNMKYGGAVLLC